MRKVFSDFQKFENMKRNSGLIIAGSIGIALIVIIGFYYNQESKINENIDNEPENYDTGNPIIDKKLDQIAKNANANDFEPAPREWITSGPFQIDRSEYLLGEKIFLRIGGLELDEKGQIAFLKQTNQTHYTVFQTIEFDGSKKLAFNYYTDIKLIKTLGLCTIDDILGEWTVVFRGTDYPNLKFNLINQTIPGDEKLFTPVC